MSEYQYYEFQAVDRPLTPQEMAELRALSTRARITPTQFQNVYHWGDFKGSPSKLMAKYFDAFVYVSNWGTHRFMLGLPRRLLDPQTARSYAVGGSLEVEASGERLVLEFTSEDEEGAVWVEDEEAASWMPALLPLRAELAGGDLRALYLGWLAGTRAGLLDDEEREPPRPPGLGRLTASLKAMAEFLRLDEDLLAVATAGSPELPEAPSPDALERWIADLPVSEKDALLIWLAKGNEAHVRAQILGRFRQAHALRADARAGGRTVAELLSAAEERAELRRRQEAERKAAEQARREREQAVARTKYLDSLIGREEALWRHVEALVETKRPKDYDQAVHLLEDLHDLSGRRESADAFAARLGSLRDRCAKRPSLLKRLDRAGLRA
jgi:hypothetical protein